MKLEPCKGCGRMILTHKIANLDVKCDPTPLDGMGIADELQHGRQLWTPRFGPGLIPKELAPARPGDAKLVREHRCTAQDAVWRPPAAGVVPAHPKALSGPPAARTAPSWVHPAPDRARPVDPAPSDRGESCDPVSAKPSSSGTVGPARYAANPSTAPQIRSGLSEPLASTTSSRFARAEATTLTTSRPPTAAATVQSATGDPGGPSNPRCEDCGLIMDDGDYVSVQLGDVYQWAQHLTNCTKEQP